MSLWCNAQVYMCPSDAEFDACRLHWVIHLQSDHFQHACKGVIQGEWLHHLLFNVCPLSSALLGERSQAIILSAFSWML